MTTYYVATNGNNANPGTSTGQPFLTIARGLQALSAGDTLYIRAGAYNESIPNTIPSGTSWSNPVTVSGYPGETVTLQPSDSLDIAISFGSGKQYIILANLIIDAPSGGFGIFADHGCHHTRYQNVEVKNAGYTGVLWGYGDPYTSPTSHEFLGGSVHDCGTNGQDHGFYISGDSNLVEDCHIYNNSGHGVHIYHSPGDNHGAPDNNIVRRCRSHDNEIGPGVGTYWGSNNQVYNNLLYRNGGGGIRQNGTSTLIYNNTIYDNDEAGIHLLGGTATIRNNIIYNTNTAISEAGGSATTSHNLTSNPSFVNAAGDNFKLQSGSAAIDTGTDLSATFTTDFDGASRPFGSAWDIGAYEFGASVGGGGDVTAPSITITGPTSDPTYPTTSTPLTVSGTASDNVAVVSVTWSNSAGGSGTATGTTSWSASIALAEGSNVITVTARDAANNTGTDIITVTKTGGGGGGGTEEDITPPTITITSPTSASTYATESTPITVAGTASDDTDVTTVTWVNNRGGSGVASGTTSWSFVASLFSGANVFTVTARDAADNTGFDSFTVNYSEVSEGGEGTGELRLTQIPVEVAIEPTDTQAQVSQLSVDVALLPDTNIRVSQQFITILSNIPALLELTSTLSFSGHLTLSIEDSPIDDWFRARAKKIIYLVRLTLRWATSSINTEYLYLSNHTYNTVAADDPPNTEYVTVLEDEDIPAYRQDLSEVFFGLSIPSYGKLVIANADGQFDDKLPINRVWRGGEVLIKMTGDRTELPLTSAITIMRGIMGKVAYSDNNIEVEIFSSKRLLEKKQVPTATFDGPNGDEIPVPVLYGYGSNISPILKDETDQTYKVADSLTAITAVYDSGVLLDPSQYTTNLASGEFTLTPNPAGQITVDAQGKSINGAFSAKRGNFIYDLLTTFGGLSASDIDAASFSQFNVDVPGDSGIYINAQTTINDVIEQLLRPVMGYLYFSRTGIAFIGRLTLPTTEDAVALTLNEKHFIPQGDASNDDAVAGDIVSIEEADLLYYKVTMNYDRNYTPMDESSLGDSDPVDSSTSDGLARREYLSKEWRETTIELTGETIGDSLYLEAGELGPLDSYFINKADADNAAQYWLDIFGVCRRLVRVRCKTSPLSTTLGSVIRLSYFSDGRYRWLNNTLGKTVSYAEQYSDNSVTLGLLI